MSEDILNMSLDDIIAKSSKPKRPREKSSKPKAETNGADGGGKGRGKKFEQSLQVSVRNTGGKRGGIGKGSRPRVLTVPRAVPSVRTAPRNEAALDGDAAWEHDLYSEGPPIRQRRAAPAESGFKLLITNLDYKVTDDDVRELFENCGPLKRAGVNYDRSGRSEESAEVVFERREDAQQALKRYNNLALDGRVMKIQLIENTGAAPTGRMLSSGIRIGGGPQRNSITNNRSFQQATGQGRREGLVRRAPLRSSGGGARRPVARGRGPAISAEDLDKDLDSYMQTE